MIFRVLVLCSFLLPNSCIVEKPESADSSESHPQPQAEPEVNPQAEEADAKARFFLEPLKKTESIAEAEQIVAERIETLRKLPLNHDMHGLHNCGVNCYQNSILQILFHTEYIQKYYASLAPSTDDKASKDEKFSAAFGRLLQHYNAAAAGAVIDPADFVEARNKYLAGPWKDSEQEDASHFLSNVLVSLRRAGNVLTKKFPYKEFSDKESADLSFVKNYNIGFDGYSFVSPLFESYKKITLEFQDSAPPEVVYVRSLRWDLKPSKKGGDLISLLTASEEWEPSDLITSNGKHLLRKKNEIAEFSKLSSYGIIYLDRSLVSDHGAPQKNNAEVSFPESFIFKNKKFSLYGVVLHAGSLEGGHYTSMVRAGDRSWYYANDEVIEAKKLDEVLKEKSRASLLFYEISPVS